MGFDNIIKESINKIIHESISLYEQQMDIYQQLQQLQQQLQMTKDPNQRAQIEQQIYQLQMQQQQSQMQGNYQGGETTLAQMGITPQAAASALGGEVLSRGAMHVADYAGDVYDRTVGDKMKIASKLAKNKLASKWHNSPNLRAGLKWGGVAAGVAVGGYALLKMKKKRCQKKCYERFTDQNQINDCLKLC